MNPIKLNLSRHEKEIRDVVQRALKIIDKSCHSRDSVVIYQ